MVFDASGGDTQCKTPRQQERGQATAYHQVAAQHEPQILAEIAVISPGAVDGIWFEQRRVVETGKKRENRIRQHEYAVVDLAQGARQHHVQEEHPPGR
jgi:hypothetical protein